ncbi:PREDICTED: 26S proteasome complex subunit DSS1-like [Amphimedon queenslandica]|uniref:26S proteasome complex subunit SEM1 n=1 Tax=Amphimedon queenslandica TaxID=400682 RepID=A0A1X7VLH1_AMPQE|nr:PREDICTED: 26S proteasome complex subunit DSS1-like [Amphimedon queenslandica]|eukprot:XP_003383908.1 PREDICTED: 26S proteasome complex subunit DSS1-like [Amphimedon queenslandica]
MAAGNKPVNKVEQSLFEEDDEFEEFPTEEWGEDEEERADKQLWEDNWDDDNVEDNFSVQLRAELERLGHKVIDNTQEQK